MCKSTPSMHKTVFGKDVFSWAPQEKKENIKEKVVT